MHTAVFIATFYVLLCSRLDACNINPLGVLAASGLTKVGLCIFYSVLCSISANAGDSTEDC